LVPEFTAMSFRSSLAVTVFLAQAIDACYGFSAHEIDRSLSIDVEATQNLNRAISSLKS
jgi:hypothetical protein